MAPRSRHPRLPRSRFRSLAGRPLVSRSARRPERLVVDRRRRLVLLSGAGLSLSRSLHPTRRRPAARAPGSAALVLLQPTARLLSLCSGLLGTLARRSGALRRASPRRPLPAAPGELLAADD